MAFQVSVVIPTYNGAHRIAKLLHALEKQDVSDFETIVVIDGSTDGTEEILNRTPWKLKLQIISQTNKGRAGARNAGAKKAGGRYLIFYDDDVEPNPNSVSLHIFGLTTAPISVGQQLEPLESKTEYGRYKASISRKWLEYLGDEPIMLNAENLFLTAANMAIKKEVFEQLGGFDDNLTDAEDYDLAVRAFNNGYKIVYNSRNQVTHLGFNTFREYIVRQREYRKAHNKLIAASPNNVLYRKYEIKPTPGKKALYFFIPGFMPRAADQGLFRFLSRKIRFALYARVISALGVYYPNRKI